MIASESAGEIINDIEIVIKLKNIENGKSVIHRYTDFLTQYRNNSPKYVNDIADRLVIFLNYIYFKLDEKVLRNIEWLTFEIGASFLEMYSVNKSKLTVKLMENTLTNFYYFMCKRRMLKLLSVGDFVIITNKVGKKSIVSPLIGMYKSYCIVKERPIHEIDRNLIFAFLDTVFETSPQIVLGVYMQIFGGLRVSEVVSLEYTDLSFKGSEGIDGIIVRINKKDLRPDLSYGHIRQAKKTGKQTIINVKGILSNLYEYHKQNYKTKLVNAIFVNEDKLPMTDSVYRYHYNNAKDKFIEKLKKSSNIKLKTYGTYLENQRWSTHLNRGVFSNMLADISDNPLEIAVWRRDKNLNSSLTYITDSMKVENKLKNLMDYYYVDKLNKNIKTRVK